MSGYQTSEKLVRLINLIREISVNPNRTCSYYANKLEISERTFYRYIDNLEYAGLPIYKNDKKKYSFIKPQKNLPEMLYKSNEAMMVWIALSEISRFMSSTGSNTELINKFKQSLPDALRQNIVSLVDRVKIYPLSAEMPELNELLLHRILQAMRDDRVLSILYFTSRSGKESWQTVYPYGLYYRRRGWYLIAYHMETQKEKIYRLSRIHKLKFKRETFTVPDGFNLSKAIECLQSDQSLCLKVKFSQQVAHLITENTLYSGEEKKRCSDGSILYTLEVTDWQRVYYWLLSYGANAEILQPQWLREKVITEIEQMQLLYQQDR